MFITPFLSFPPMKASSVSLDPLTKYYAYSQLHKHWTSCLLGLRFTKTHCCSSHVRTHWWFWVLANHSVSKGQASWSDLTWPTSSWAKTKALFGTGEVFRWNPVAFFFCSFVCLFFKSYHLWHQPPTTLWLHLESKSNISLFFFRAATCGTKHLFRERACVTWEP